MNKTSFSKRESDDSEFSKEDSYEVRDEGNYETYRRKSLPEGYTAYRNNSQDNEVVYDRYDSVYEACEQPLQGEKVCLCFKKVFCCKIDWLFKYFKKHCLVSLPDWLLKKAPIKDSQLRKVTNIAQI